MKKWGLRTYAIRQNLSVDGIEHDASCKIPGSALVGGSGSAMQRLLSQRRKLQCVAENSAQTNSIHLNWLSKACQRNDRQAEKDFPSETIAYGLLNTTLENGRLISTSAPQDPLLIRGLRDGILSTSAPAQPILTKSIIESVIYNPMLAVSFINSSDIDYSSILESLVSIEDNQSAYPDNEWEQDAETSFPFLFDIRKCCY